MVEWAEQSGKTAHGNSMPMYRKSAFDANFIAQFQLHDRKIGEKRNRCVAHRWNKGWFCLAKKDVCLECFNKLDFKGMQKKGTEIKEGSKFILI